MPRPKNLTAADIIDLDIKAMLRGAVHKLGGAERLGELLAELGDNNPDMPSSTPESIRARVLTELARLLGQHGGEGPSGSLIDDESLNSRIAMHEASRPPEEEEPFDDDDSE